MRKSKWWIGAVALLGVSFAVLLVFRILTDQARRSPRVIRADLLSLAPLGTSVTDVKALIVKNGWDKGKCWREDSGGNWSEIMTQYGGFRRIDNPLAEVLIEVHWHFDENGGLRNISLHYYEGGLLGFTTKMHVEGE